MLWWLAPPPHGKRVPGSIPSLSVWSVHVLPMFTPQNMQVRSPGEGNPRRNKPGWGMLLSRGWQVAYLFRQENQRRRRMCWVPGATTMDQHVKNHLFNQFFKHIYTRFCALFRCKTKLVICKLFQGLSSGRKLKQWANKNLNPLYWLYPR